MKVLVTGGAGFIGSHICKSLLKGGHSVTCIDNFDPYYDPGYKRENIAGLDLELVEGDILNYDKLKKLCVDVDYVYHEAAQAGVRASVEDPIKPHRVNTEGTLNVLRAAVKTGVKKVISASSSSVYGTVKYLPFDENHPNNPRSPYGVSKLAAEYYCNVFTELYGIKTVNLRYFTVYGPRMRPDLAISIFTRSALANEPIEIFGDGSKTRDFTYIDDIVSANMALMEKGEGTYNIGAGNRISVNELAQTIIDLTNSDSKIIFTEDKLGDVEHTWANIEKAKNELSWEPKIDIKEGLKKYTDVVSGEI